MIEDLRINLLSGVDPDPIQEKEEITNKTGRKASWKQKMQVLDEKWIPKNTVIVAQRKQNKDIAPQTQKI